MNYISDLKLDLEKWWKHLDKIMTVAEGTGYIIIDGVSFRRWGGKHLYYQKTKYTFTYLITIQSTEPYMNSNGDVIYPIVDIYIDICHGKNRTTYKKHRVHCSC